MASYETVVTTPIPRWLNEHCVRLVAIDADIVNLNLNIRRLNRPMMEALAKALAHNTKIEIVNFTSSFMNTNDETAILPLTEVVLPNHPSLQIVHLSYNRFTNIISIGQALQTNTTLRELYLDYNCLTKTSAIAIANGLMTNRTLQVLRLQSNQIGDEGGIALANALRTNTTLQELGLSKNQLGSSTGHALLDTLQHHNISLKRLTLAENPNIPPVLRLKVQYYVRANQVGRHVLRQQQKFNINLWPSVLEQLEPDMTYYFLQQKPDLFDTMPTTTPSTNTVG